MKDREVIAIAIIAFCWGLWTISCHVVAFSTIKAETAFSHFRDFVIWLQSSQDRTLEGKMVPVTYVAPLLLHWWTIRHMVGVGFFPDGFWLTASFWRCVGDICGRHFRSFHRRISTHGFKGANPLLHAVEEVLEDERWFSFTLSLLVFLPKLFLHMR